MNDADVTHVRELLLESFTAGWQAALAVNITNPRVLAVVESCFELWLKEAIEETEVLGLSFRARPDLPSPTVAADAVALGRHSAATVPAQRTSSSPTSDDAAPASNAGKRRRDRRRRIGRPV
jgi:hypothetical protein